MKNYADFFSTKNEKNVGTRYRMKALRRAASPRSSSRLKKNASKEQKVPKKELAIFTLRR